VNPKNVFATPWQVASIEDCRFYHSMNIPGHGFVQGNWDIVGNESQYTGEVAFKDKRVLEIGPGSGVLSFFMERDGAEVVSVEVAEDFKWDFYWDLQDAAPEDLGIRREAQQNDIEKMKNSYWFCHRAFSSKAKVHYGSAYHIPEELGKFDISVLCCILLHNKHPLQILENCARVTGETVVVTEPLHKRPLSQASLEFQPTDNQHSWHTWWRFSPDFFVKVLRSMGFPHSRVTFHTQQSFGKPVNLFTVVASRNALAEDQSENIPVNVQVNCPVERLRIGAGESISLPVDIVNLTDFPLSPFTEHPILMSYRWRRRFGKAAVSEGKRTPLPRNIYKGDRENIIMNIQAPPESGNYLLEVTMLKKGVTWYDNKIAGLPLKIKTVITPR
jgi:SAM-dependent methyltransferase